MHLTALRVSRLLRPLLGPLETLVSQEEVDLFGGQVGNYEGNLGTFDGGCVDNPFRWCDNLDNNDPKVLTFMSRAFANMVVQMAFDTKVMSSSSDTGGTSTTRLAAKTSRRFAAK